MESGSRTDNPPERITTHRLADIVGTLIALLTLTIPVVAIAYFSSSNAQVLITPTYSAPHSGE